MRRRGIAAILEIAAVAATLLLAPRTAGADDGDDPSASGMVFRADSLAGRLAPSLLGGGTLLGGGFSLAGGYRPPRSMYFAGFDVWRHGYGAHAGSEWTGFGQSGFVLRATSAVSHDTFDAARRFRSESVALAILPGFRLAADGFELKLFAGPEACARLLTSPVLGWLLRPQVGLRVAADLWGEPIAGWMIAIALTGTTLDAAYGGRFATGWRPYDIAWIGPELALSGDRLSTQYRVGAHVTGLRIGAHEWSGAAGYSSDSLGRAGAYVRVGVLRRTTDRLTAF